MTLLYSPSASIRIDAVAVAVVFVSGNAKKVAMVQPQASGSWGFPSGRMDPGEAPEDAARRVAAATLRVDLANTPASNEWQRDVSPSDVSLGQQGEVSEAASSVRLHTLCFVVWGDAPSSVSSSSARVLAFGDAKRLRATLNTRRVLMDLGGRSVASTSGFRRTVWLPVAFFGAGILAGLWLGTKRR
jgi:NUDIX domain